MKEEAYRLMEAHDDSYWWYRARKQLFIQLFKRFDPGSGEILDYGCGYGSNSIALKEAGFRVISADINQDALAHCEANGLLTLNLNETAPNPSQFEAILLADVLEHVEDESRLLNQIKTWLRPGGKLIITVPAYQCLWSGEDYVSKHYRRYTLNLLNKKLSDHGYQKVWSSYSNTLLFPLESAYIILKKSLKPSSKYESNLNKLHPVIDSILYNTYLTEIFMMKLMNYPFGLTAISVSSIK